MIETRPLVFVSYSHHDVEWLRRIPVMLQPLVRNWRLEVWADEHVPVGADWRRAIGWRGASADRLVWRGMPHASARWPSP